MAPKSLNFLGNSEFCASTPPTHEQASARASAQSQREYIFDQEQVSAKMSGGDDDRVQAPRVCCYRESRTVGLNGKAPA
jgi:hypothetical protein